MDTIHHNARKAGFTLAEILLAMMVFAIAITTILALLARSIETADSILIKDEAIGLSSAVDGYMSELPFNDAFNDVKEAETLVLFAYQYRAVNPIDASGPSPYTGTGALGTDYVVVTGVREQGDAQLAADINALEGRLFQVHLEVSEANPEGSDITGRDPTSVDPATGYDSAVLVLLANFYPVPYYDFTLDTSEVDSAFSFNFAVRR